MKAHGASEISTSPEMSAFPESSKLTELLVLEEDELEKVSLQSLRDAYKKLHSSYKELHATYLDLHKRHHERITEALADRKEEGKKTGGDVPYGYKLAKDGETLIEEEAEQAVIAEAVRLRQQGLSLRRIAQELWKRKMRPRKVLNLRPGRVLKTKRPGEFDPTQIKRMIEAHAARLAWP